MHWICGVLNSCILRHRYIYDYVVLYMGEKAKKEGDLNAVLE